MDGIAWFTFETMSRMTKNHPEHHFYFIFDRPYDPEFIFSENITPIVIGPQSRHPLLWYWWFEKSIPSVLKKIKPDVFLSPDGYLSLKSKAPCLTVIHDINFEHRPQDLPLSHRKYYQHYFPKFAHHAHRIATVSEFSKNDISSKYGIDPTNIDVIYNGISDRFRPLSSDEISAFQKKHTQNHPYFLVLGSLHPRKNIANILSAYDQFKDSGNYPHKLLFVGRKQWWTSKMQSALDVMKFKADVIFQEGLSNEKVALALGASTALLYVSLFEGFGIPMTEAMKAGVPVITSNVSSMPEIASDAALFCDPYSTVSIAEQMKKLIHEPGLSESLIQKGFTRATDFSWDKTAGLLWKSVERMLR